MKKGKKPSAKGDLTPGKRHHGQISRHEVGNFLDNVAKRKPEVTVESLAKTFLGDKQLNGKFQKLLEVVTTNSNLGATKPRIDAVVSIIE